MNGAQVKTSFLFLLSLLLPMAAIAQSWSAQFGPPPIGQGLNNAGQTLLVYQDKLVVGGDFTQAGPVSANRVAAWDGTQWTAFGTGITGGTVYDLTEYNGELIAAGLFGLRRWNGATWTALTPPGGSQPLSAVHSHAGLLFVNPDVAGISTLAWWDGNTWAGTPMPTPDSNTLDMTSYQGQLVLAGGLPEFGLTARDKSMSRGLEDPQGFLLAWNGTEFGGPGFSFVKVPYCLVVHENLVYVGAGLVGPQYLATWDGGTVSPSTLSDIEPLCLESYHGRLVIGSYSVTSFDGSTEVPLGNSPTWIFAARVFQGDLYVTGPFTSTEGSLPSYYIAKWSEPVTGVDGPSLPSSGLRIEGSPNPFNPSVTLSIHVPSKGNVDVTVCDATGRLVRHLESGARDAGTHQVRWDGKADNGSALASGVYFARVVSNGASASRKLVLLK